jgi:hypothetical protein
MSSGLSSELFLFFFILRHLFKSMYILLIYSGSSNFFSLVDRTHILLLLLECQVDGMKRKQL